MCSKITECGTLISSSEIIWKVNIHDDTVLLGDCVTSPAFLTYFNRKINTWFFDLYPKGETRDCENYMSLYLRYTGQESLEVTYELSLINMKNEKVYQIDSKSLSSFETHSSWGYKKFLNRSILFDTQNQLLSDDNEITVLCQIKAKDSIVTKNKDDLENIKRLKELTQFGNLLSSKELSDVILEVNGKKFYSHKCILAARSPVFQAMFMHDMREKKENLVKIDDVKPEVFAEFLSFIYNGKVFNIENIVCELLTVADKYEVEGLKKMCGDIMCSNLNEKNVLDYLNLVHNNNAFEAKKKIIKWISKHLQDKFFLEMSDFKEFVIQYPELMFEIVQDLSTLTQECLKI